MVWAKIHEFNGNQKTLATSDFEQDGMVEFEASAERLYIDGDTIKVKSQADVDAEKLNEWRENCAVSPAKIRLALLDAGLLDTVENAVKTAPKAMQIKWQFEPLIKRLDTDLVTFAKNQLSMSDSEIDEIFSKAVKG